MLKPRSNVVNMMSIFELTRYFAWPFISPSVIQAILKDLGANFHIIEAMDHNNATKNTGKIEVDLQIQGRVLFCVTFHISGCIN